MRAAEIIERGIQRTEFADKTYSHTGQLDFKEEQPEIKVLGPKGPYSRPRTKASLNNSYS